MELAITHASCGDSTVVQVTGEVDAATAPQLRKRLRELTDAGEHRLVVDLESVEFMDSTGLGALISTLKRVRENDGYLRLVCSRRPILKIMSITGLDSVISVYDTLAEALAPPAA
jgi:anti-sigma B factor antagonist